MVIKHDVMLWLLRRIKLRSHAACTRGPYVAIVAPIPRANKTAQFASFGVFSGNGEALHSAHTPCYVACAMRVDDPMKCREAAEDLSATVYAKTIGVSFFSDIADCDVIRPVKPIEWAAPAVTDVMRIS